MVRNLLRKWRSQTVAEGTAILLAGIAVLIMAPFFTAVIKYSIFILVVNPKLGMDSIGSSAKVLALLFTFFLHMAIWWAIADGIEQEFIRRDIASMDENNRLVFNCEWDTTSVVEE